VTLVYHADRVMPKPTVLVDVAPDSSFGTWPSEFQLQVKVNGALVTFVNGEQTLRFSVGATNDKTYRIGGQFTPNSLTHGTVYPMEILVSAKIGATLYTNRWVTQYLHIDEANNPIARGWTVAGIQRAFVQSDNSVLITEGDGSAVYFKQVVTFGTGSWPSPAGEFSTLTFSGSNYIRTYPDSTKVTFNSSGYMTSVTDRWGNSTSITYDGSNRIWKITDPISNVITLAYGTYGLASITDPFSRVTNDSVTSARTMIWFKDPGGGSTQFGYDGSSRLQTVTNRKGAVTTFGYDSQSGRLASITAPAVPIYTLGTLSPVTSFVPWQKGGVPYSATASTPFVQPQRDTVFASLTEPGTAVTRFTVNRWGSPILTVQPLTDTTVVAYTTNGQPTTTRRPGYASNLADTVFYNASGLPTYVRRAGSTTTSVTYGGWAQPTDMSGTGQPTVHYNLGANGRVTSTTVGGVKVDSLRYDSRGRILARRDGNGALVDTLTYYPSGTHQNLNTAKNVRGGVTTYTYDTYGRTASVTAPYPYAARYFFYDGLNRLLRDSLATTPSATVTRFVYDSLFQTRVVDPKNQAYAYVYNALGWLVADTVPAGRVASYQYNKDGDLMQLTNRRSQTVTFGYDALHRLTSRSGTSSVSWSYPSANHGLVVAGTSAQSTETIYANVRGTPDSIKTVLTTPTQTYWRRYVYSSAGLLTNVNLSGPASPALVNRSYFYNTAKGTIDSLVLGTQVIKPSFDLNLRDTSLTFPGGDRKRIIRGSGGPPIQDTTAAAYNLDILRDVGLDLSGRVAQQLFLASPTQLVGRFYTYDGVGRLITGQNKSNNSGVSLPPGCNSVTDGYGPGCTPGGSWTVYGTTNYTYDAVGNRTDLSANYTSGTNRITAFAGWSYTTDLDGNVTNRDSTGVNTVYTWNAEGQLTGTTKTGQSSATYYYDAFGRIVRKDLGGSASSYFIWDGDNLLAEFGSNGTTKAAEYSYYGPDQLHALIENNGGSNTTYYAHQDALGNTIALTNSAGTASVRTYQYDDWGRLTGGTTSLPQTDKDRARWKGALWMGTESDLYYMRNRWYEPASGRFLSEDPIGLDGGINPVAFTASDPVNGIDPLGLSDCLWIDSKSGKCLDIFITAFESEGGNWRRILNAIYDLGSRESDIMFSLPTLQGLGGGPRSNATSTKSSKDVKVVYLRTPSQCFADNNAWLGDDIQTAIAIGTGTSGGGIGGGLLVRVQGQEIVRQVFRTGYVSDFTKGGVASVAAALPYLKAGSYLLRAGIAAAVVPAYFLASRAICQLSPSYGVE
jgi:RHS repeat-associated protein